MNWKGHLTVGFFTAIGITAVIKPGLVETGLLVLLCAFSALLPDIDHDMSKGRKIVDSMALVIPFALGWSATNNFIASAGPAFLFFGIYTVLFRVFKPKHRGITHTGIATIIFASVIYLLYGPVAGLYAGAGYLSHLIADKHLRIV